MTATYSTKQQPRYLTKHNSKKIRFPRLLFIISDLPAPCSAEENIIYVVRIKEQKSSKFFVFYRRFIVTAKPFLGSWTCLREQYISRNTHWIRRLNFFSQNMLSIDCELFTALALDDRGKSKCTKNFDMTTHRP